MHVRILFAFVVVSLFRANSSIGEGLCRCGQVVAKSQREGGLSEHCKSQVSKSLLEYCRVYRVQFEMFCVLSDICLLSLQ